MEVKGLKLSSSFYFADFDQLKSSFKQQIFAKSKIIWRLNPLALNVQCKTFQFCKAGATFNHRTKKAYEKSMITRLLDPVFFTA